jgi:hypothetical protein
VRQLAYRTVPQGVRALTNQVWQVYAILTQGFPPPIWNHPALLIRNPDGKVTLFCGQFRALWCIFQPEKYCYFLAGFRITESSLFLHSSASPLTGIAPFYQRSLWRFNGAES